MDRYFELSCETTFDYRSHSGTHIFIQYSSLCGLRDVARWLRRCYRGSLSHWDPAIWYQWHLQGPLPKQRAYMATNIIHPAHHLFKLLPFRMRYRTTSAEQPFYCMSVCICINMVFKRHIYKSIYASIYQPDFVVMLWQWHGDNKVLRLMSTTWAALNSFAIYNIIADIYPGSKSDQLARSGKIWGLPSSDLAFWCTC